MLKKLNYKYILIFIFAITIFLCSWNSDDAFHGFVMVKNLLNGNGFVYNVGERVNAATCPLFYLIIAFFSFFTKEIFLTTIVLCVIFSTIAYSIILLKGCKTVWQSIILTILLLFSSSFNSFATSGLENSLLFLEEILFFYILTKYEKYNFKQLFLLAFICGCLLITRTDAGLILFFVTAYCFLFKHSCSKPKMFLSGFLGLLPFILWSIFSWFYYGLIFPNTYYAKLNTGYAKIEYIEKGLGYLKTTLQYDCFVVLIPIVTMIVMLINKDKKLKLLGIGFFTKLIYLTFIGGDFMIGRHYTDLYILGLFVLLYIINQEKDENKSLYICLISCIFTVIGIVFTFYSTLFFKQYLYPYGDLDYADERNCYYDNTGTIPYIKGLLNKELLYQKQWDDMNYLTYPSYNYNGMLLSFAPGMVVYDLVDSMYISDSIGLGDPLFSKLPAIKTKDWRIGHIRRFIPEGYGESLVLGKNKIENQSLKEYYDIFHSIISDDLFNKDRIDKLINFTFGKYDYLIDDYIKDYETKNVYHYKPYILNFSYNGIFNEDYVLCTKSGYIFYGYFNNNDFLILEDGKYKIKLNYELKTQNTNNIIEISSNENLFKYSLNKDNQTFESDWIEFKDKGNFEFIISLSDNSSIKIKDIYLERQEN